MYICNYKEGTMNKIIKLVIAVLMIATGVYLITNRNIGWGIVLIILSALPIFLFFRNEFIFLAFWRLRKQDLAGARKYLDKITNVKTQLVRKQYGYYNYLMGITDSQNNPKQSEIYMKKALEYGLSFKHDRALATMNLAAGAMMRGSKIEAERLLAEAKRLDSSGMLKDQIKMLKEQLKRTNISKGNIMNTNKMGFGKKRIIR